MWLKLGCGVHVSSCECLGVIYAFDLKSSNLRVSASATIEWLSCKTSLRLTTSRLLPSPNVAVFQAGIPHTSLRSKHEQTESVPCSAQMPINGFHMAPVMSQRRNFQYILEEFF